jgi:hypothetical protein
MIIGVAVRLKDGTEIRMPSPHRHCDILQFAHQGGKNDACGGKNQGFYTTTGEYLDREQAMQYVRSIGQKLLPMQCGHMNLFSEDLW